MTSTRQSENLYLTLLALLVLFAGWSYLRLSASRSLADEAARNTLACETLVNDIESLRVRPSLAALHVQSDSDLSTQIEKTAAATSLPIQSILSIEPRRPQRIPDSAYLEQSTRIEFASVTLQKLVAFLIRLLQDSPELRLTSVRLSAPRHEPPPPAAEQWGAEVTLTYLIFSPN